MIPEFLFVLISIPMLVLIKLGTTTPFFTFIWINLGGFALLFFCLWFSIRVLFHLLFGWR